jgi:outer membrane protein assembly factor BamB
MHQISKQLFMLITLMLTSLSPAMAEISYPTNPLYQPKRLIISQNGISSFDLQTGRLVWQKLNKLQTFEPVLTGEYLLVGSSQGLQVLSAKTGQLLWQHGGGIIFSPIVENNTAYLTARDGRIWALDLTT